MLCQKKHEGSIDLYLFLFMDYVSFLSQVSEDNGCECSWKRNIQGSKETNVKGLSNIHGSKRNMPGSDRTWAKRSIVWIGPERRRHKRNMVCQKKHEGKVRNTIGGKQHPVFLFIRIYFFSWTVFLFLPCVSFPSQVSGDNGCDDGES